MGRTPANADIEPVHARQPALDDSMDGGQVLHAAIQCCLEQIQGNARAIGAGLQNEEFVHQLRVGIRRLRTALRELHDLSPDLDTSLQKPLTAAFRSLGSLRDLQTASRVIAAAAMTGAKPATTTKAMAAATTETQASAVPVDDAPARTVRDPEFRHTLSALDAFTRSRTTDTPPPRTVLKTIRRRLERLHRLVIRDGCRFRALKPSAQHRVRKRLKRLRYLSELTGSLFDPTRVERYLRRMQVVQDELGKHMDLVTARNLCAQVQPGDQSRQRITGARLSDQQRETAHSCSKALRKLARARQFWRARP